VTERNQLQDQGKQAHPVLKYRVPLRVPLGNRSCSNKQQHKRSTDGVRRGEGPFGGPLEGGGKGRDREQGDCVNWEYVEVIRGE
jgi:hypothetical protein